MKQFILLIFCFQLLGCMASVPTKDVQHLGQYQIVSNIQSFSAKKLAAELAKQDVVFFGEIHQHPGLMSAQADILTALNQYKPVVLSMEQFERDVQQVVDDYLADRMGEAEFIEKSRAWQGYRFSYRLLIEFAKQQHIPVVAANAPRPIVHCVGKKGLAWLKQLPTKKRQWAAKNIVVESGAYQDKVATQLSGHHHQVDKKILAAQMTWDATMAESIVFAKEKYPQRLLLHINGHVHSDDFLGTVEQVKSTAPELSVAVISPWPVGQEERAKADYWVKVLPLPKAYLTREEERLAIKKTMKQNNSYDCENYGA